MEENDESVMTQEVDNTFKTSMCLFREEIMNITLTSQEILGCFQPSYLARYQPSGSHAGSALRLIPDLMILALMNRLVHSPSLVSYRI